MVKTYSHLGLLGNGEWASLSCVLKKYHSFKGVHMTITEHIHDDRLEVRFKGTLDHTIGPACERAIRHAHALGSKQLQINLADVTAVEKLSLGTLCFALHTVRQLGIEGTVLNAPASVQTILSELDENALEKE